MNQGIIKNSISLYPSPVLLIKKKDGGYHLYVDYRALNALTIKYKFPLPTNDELLGELKGVIVFSIVDLRFRFHQIRILRFRFHQIRMSPTNTHKATFRTHCGHFEFLVMSFGLCNALATFQNTINFVFKYLLRKFVNIFFDGILV